MLAADVCIESKECAAKASILLYSQRYRSANSGSLECLWPSRGCGEDWKQTYAYLVRFKAPTFKGFHPCEVSVLWLRESGICAIRYSNADTNYHHNIYRYDQQPPTKKYWWPVQCSLTYQRSAVISSFGKSCVPPGPSERYRCGINREHLRAELYFGQRAVSIYARNG